MAGLTTYLVNKIIDFIHRGQSFAPPATVYIELVSTTPTATSAALALSGTGYQRRSIPSNLVSWAGTQADGSTAASSGTSRTTSNNVDIDYGVAPAAWGTASHWEAYDALSGGNRLYYGTIVNGVGTPTPRIINVGDPVKFPPGALRIEWG